MRIADYIAQAKETGTLLALHSEGQSDSKFFAGYVEEIDGDEFRLRWVNPRGKPGGAEPFGWFHLSEINWIESDTPYLRALAKLNATWSQFEGQKPARWRTSQASVKRALKDCLSSGAVCSIQYSVEHCIAKVEEMHQHFVKLTLYEEDMSYRGELVGRMDQVQAIRVGGIDEAVAVFLFQG